MEHTESPARYNLAGREIALRFNARAWRLIKEHTGFDVLNPKASEGAASLPDSVTNLLVNSTALPRVLWATMQNQGNGDKESDWPAFDWVEENLDLQSFEPAMKALATARGLGETQEQPTGKRRPRTNGSTGLTSGPEAPVPTA